MPIKISQFTPRMAKLERLTAWCWLGCGTVGIHTHFWGGVRWNNSLAGSYKVKPAVFISRYPIYLPKKNENIVPQKDLHKGFYSSFNSW